jgi:aspartate-semialdehyde dehydrogenase
MNHKKYSVAILGATGNVGRLILEILKQRNFPASSIKLLASARSVGQKIISNQGNEYQVELACPPAFDGIDIVFASAGASVSKLLAPEITKRGGVIIDNSSAFRMEKDVPLVVPQVNAQDIKQNKGIIANPNCSTAPLVLILKPLDENFKLKRVVVSTYQSVSGAGKAAMDELYLASRDLLKHEDPAHAIDSYQYKSFVHPIAFNLIPQIDVFTENGYTKEEMKLINESRKMLHRPDLAITCTAVRVPVFISHSESVNVEFETPVSLDAIRSVIESIPDLVLQDDPSKNQYPCPAQVAGQDPVFVGRLRVDESQPNSFNFWLVSDNLRIGAALNAVRIGEELVLQNAFNNFSVGLG